MNRPPTALGDHERALLLVLRDGDPAAEAFLALLEHPEVQAWQLPAPWVGEGAGVDLLGALPDLGAITRESLPRALRALLALHTRERLETLAAQVWRAADESVRTFYLRRPLLGTLASIFRLAPRARDLAPPRGFVEDQVFVHRFELAYRLLRAGGPADPTAPPEEGSLVLYPFDPANGVARREAGLGEGAAPVLEAFAYAAGRARHRRVLEDLAARRGWRVVDTARAS